MANKRVKDLPNANTLADADELIIDSSSAGTRRISYSELKTEVAGDYVAAPSTYKVAPLNSSNKIDATYLPTTGDTAKGSWNASTNTPTLANGTGAAGDYYDVTTAGVSLGISFSVGDVVKYDGANWFKIDSVANIFDGISTVDQVKTLAQVPDIGLQANMVPLCGMLNSGAWVDWDSHFSQGTWVPTVSFGGASSGTYNIQEGGYQKTGQLVHVWCQVNNTTKHASNTGSVTVDGLPYTAAGSNVPYVGSAALHNAASLSGQTVTLIAGGTNSAMIFDSGVNGTSAVTDVNYNSSTIIRISITYKIA